MVSHYVHTENIKRYQKRLLEEADPRRRAVLTELLTNELASRGDALGVPKSKPE